MRFLYAVGEPLLMEWHQVEWGVSGCNVCGDVAWALLDGEPLCAGCVEDQLERLQAVLACPFAAGDAAYTFCGKNCAPWERSPAYHL